MWFTYSLIALLSWGGSDLFSKMGTNPKDKYSHWKLITVVGLVMGLHGFYYMWANGISYDPVNMLKYLPVSLLYIGSMAIGYAGLRYIELSISSPVCNSSGAVAALLCFMFLGQEMSGIQFVAVALISAGIFALALLEKRNEDRRRQLEEIQVDRKYQVSFFALFLPLMYCLIDGLGIFADAYVLDEMEYMTEIEGNLSYEFTFLICGLASLIYLIVKKQKLNVREAGIKGVAAVFETVGQFFYIHAIADNAIVAAPMIASYSIVSVLLSRIFLKEKLSYKHYLIIAVVMVGIIILGDE
ncbi:MAG: DMT family transporter [Clostridiales bacterium]|nr:DMT family transporter [Clostridiales bacterium]